MGRLTYQTLRENAMDVIRIKILSRGLVPEMRITEQDISDGPGVSRGPIREALRQLEQGGLVEYVRNVGCSVGNITLEDIYETCLLRITYEISAVKLCRGAFSEAAFMEIDVALESMEDLRDMGYNKPIACDNTLHEIIIRSTGSPRLIKGWADLNCGDAINCYAGDPDGRVTINHQCPIRKELTDVCRTGNTEDICRAISNHYIKIARRWPEGQGTPEDHFKFSTDVIDGWV